MSTFLFELVDDSLGPLPRETILTYLDISPTASLSTAVEGGHLPKNSIASQMTVLNDAYAGIGIQFILKSTTYTKNKIWFEKASTDAK